MHMLCQVRTTWYNVSQYILFYSHVTVCKAGIIKQETKTYYIMSGHLKKL